MTFEATCDPDVVIESRGEVNGQPWIRYRNTATGRRWEVHGRCIGLGFCWEGAVGPAPELDCPVTPEFEGCCPFVFVELDPASE